MTPRADVLTILLRHRRRFERWLRRILRLQPRNPLDVLLHAHEERMDAERRIFANAVVDAIRATQTNDGRAFDQFAYMRIQYSLRTIFDEFYGRYPGDFRCRFGSLVLDQARAARWLAFESSAQDVRRRLRAHPDLLRAIRAEVA